MHSDSIMICQTASDLTVRNRFKSSDLISGITLAESTMKHYAIDQLLSCRAHTPRPAPA